MVGILLSYWGGLFSGAMLVSGRVNSPYFEDFKPHSFKPCLDNGGEGLDPNLDPTMSRVPEVSRTRVGINGLPTLVVEPTPLKNITLL